MSSTDKNIIVLNEVDSTNNYAKCLMSAKVEEGTVVLAHYQQKGKGQQGNYWESEPDKNLLFSLILFPDWLVAEKQFLVSKIVSLALVEVLKKHVNEVSVKWPNDIYVGNKKIAGILIESSIKGANLGSTIIGVGLNVNQEIFISGAPNPTSLKSLSGECFEIMDILNDFLHIFYHWLEVLKSEDYGRVDAAYHSNLFRKNDWCNYRKVDEEFEARIVGIGAFGELQLELRSGEIESFMFKEVEFKV